MYLACGKSQLRWRNQGQWQGWGRRERAGWRGRVGRRGRAGWRGRLSRRKREAEDFISRRGLRPCRHRPVSALCPGQAQWLGAVQQQLLRRRRLLFLLLLTLKPLLLLLLLPLALLPPLLGCQLGGRWGKEAGVPAQAQSRHFVRRRQWRQRLRLWQRRRLAACLLPRPLRRRFPRCSAAWPGGAGIARRSAALSHSAAAAVEAAACTSTCSPWGLLLCCPRLGGGGHTGGPASCRQALAGQTRPQLHRGPISRCRWGRCALLSGCYGLLQGGQQVLSCGCIRLGRRRRCQGWHLSCCGRRWPGPRWRCQCCHLFCCRRSWPGHRGRQCHCTLRLRPTCGELLLCLLRSSSQAGHSAGAGVPQNIAHGGSRLVPRRSCRPGLGSCRRWPRHGAGRSTGRQHICHVGQRRCAPTAIRGWAQPTGRPSAGLWRGWLARHPRSRRYLQPRRRRGYLGGITKVAPQRLRPVLCQVLAQPSRPLAGHLQAPGRGCSLQHSACQATRLA